MEVTKVRIKDGSGCSRKVFQAQGGMEYVVVPREVKVLPKSIASSWLALDPTLEKA